MREGQVCEKGQDSVKDGRVRGLVYKTDGPVREGLVCEGQVSVKDGPVRGRVFEKDGPVRGQVREKDGPVREGQSCERREKDRSLKRTVL